MKKFVPVTYLAILSLLFFSCNKNESHYIFAKEEVPAKLESKIYPVITGVNGEIVLGKEQSTCTVGETVTLFLPYEVVADDIQNGRLTITDGGTGEVVRELEMTMSTDLSIINVIVPEEIQGSSFLFVNIPIEGDMAGKSFHIATKMEAYKLTSQDEMKHAFNVQ
jgi:hypothetical protein